jgi:sugar/nucleoside kinase (ribokinase family)
VRRLLPLLNIFFPSENEAMGISGEKTPGAALERLASSYPTTLVVMSMGPEGVQAARGQGERWALPALPAAFVDAVGAGDAFAAGFLSQFLRDAGDVPSALASALAAGAAAVGRPGACDAPISREWHAEVLRRGSAAPEASDH